MREETASKVCMYVCMYYAFVIISHTMSAILKKITKFATETPATEIVLIY